MIESEDPTIARDRPLGEPLTLAALPSRETARWVVWRKSQIVAGVNGGLLTIDEACEGYGLAPEKFAW
jgi:hypothetical protein